MTSTDGRHAILVIANRTCPCPALVDEVARRAIDRPAEVLVVADGTPPRRPSWAAAEQP
jgi:hypothetical protein